MAFAAALAEFTKKDEQKHPKFMKLLDALRTKITDDGINIGLHKELVRAKCEAEEAEQKFAEALVLKEACDNIMTKSYKAEGGSSPEERDALVQELQNWCSRMRIQECALLGIPGIENPKLPPVSEKFVRTTVIPLLEKDLREICQTIIDSLETPCSVEDVPHAVRAMVEEEESLKKRFHIAMLEQSRMLLSFEEMLEDYLKTKLEFPVASAEVAVVGAEAQCLRLEVDCSEAKMRLAMQEMHHATYSKEKVEALKHIRKELQKEMMSCRKNIKEMKSTLERFEGLNPRVAEKIEEYGAVKAEIDRLKRALSAYDKRC